MFRKVHEGEILRGGRQEALGCVLKLLVFGVTEAWMQMAALPLPCTCYFNRASLSLSIN